MVARAAPRLARSPAAAELPWPRQVKAVGFVVAGEPLAVDLADTLVTSASPPIDLLADAARSRQFWALQAERLPPGATRPSYAATRALRDAIRAVFDARLQHRHPPAEAVAAINAAASAAPTSPRLNVVDDELRRVDCWHTTQPGALALAAAARSAIEVLTSTAAGRLRRCANPTCSMLFLGQTPRRQWCTPTICGNRARVARHYRRSRTTGSPAQ